MKIIKNLMMCTTVLCTSLGWATNYYVSPTGRNIASTNVNDPGRYIQRALDLVNPGDVVYLMNGEHVTYHTDLPVAEFKRSGTAQNHILLTNYAGHKPKIKFDGWSGIRIAGASFIDIVGIEIEGANQTINLADAEQQKYVAEQGSTNCYLAPTGGTVDKLYNGTGIEIMGPGLAWSGNATTVPFDIKIENCKIHDCPSSGISAQKAGGIQVLNNEVYNNNWYTTYGTSAIHFYHSHGLISGNKVYHNKLLINPKNKSCTREGGNGIMIERSSADINENLVVYNGGSGISIEDAEYDIEIEANTIALNGTIQGYNLNPAELKVIRSGYISSHSNIYFSNSIINPNSNGNHHVIYQNNIGYQGYIDSYQDLFYGESLSPERIESYHSYYSGNEDTYRLFTSGSSITYNYDPKISSFDLSSRRAFQNPLPYPYPSLSQGAHNYRSVCGSWGTEEDNFTSIETSQVYQNYGYYGPGGSTGPKHFSSSGPYVFSQNWNFLGTELDGLTSRTTILLKEGVEVQKGAEIYFAIAGCQQEFDEYPANQYTYIESGVNGAPRFGETNDNTDSEENLTSLSMSPNPIKSGEQVSLSATVAKATIMSLEGSILSVIENTNVISTENLSPGLYFIKTENETLKLIVE